MFTPLRKFVLEVIGWNMSVTNIFWLDLLIMPIILCLAFKISFFVVHILAPFLFFNSGLMSFIHWTLRVAIILLGIDWLSLQFTTIKNFIYNL